MYLLAKIAIPMGAAKLPVHPLRHHVTAACHGAEFSSDYPSKPLPMRTRSLAQILILLLATLVPKTASADRTDDGVHSVRFQVRGEQIHVMYDLVAAGTCQISLRMLHGSVEAPVQPRSLSGDVGAGITSGNKLIVWDVLADVAQLEGSDYVFEVSAIKQNRNGRWLWLGGAGLLAGAGAAYFMTSGDAATPEATGIFDIDIPDPHVAEETTQ